MHELTAIIPIGPRHIEIAQRAIESAKVQSIEIAIITIEDAKNKGPAWARNRGIERVQTPWLTFLDADDEFESEYAAKTLPVARANWPDGYVYTGWYERFTDGIVQVKMPPPCTEVWQKPGAGHHIISAVIPTHWTRKIGGFDEGLKRGGEDRDFFFKLTRAGCCGMRIDEPLVWYHDGGEGKQSLLLRNDVQEQKRQKQILLDRYGGIMGCKGCGGQSSARNAPVNSIRSRFDHNAPSEGMFDRGGSNGKIYVKFDRLVLAMFAGRKSVTGRGTGYTYPRCGQGDKLYIDKRDLDAMPRMWREISVSRSEPLQSLPSKRKKKKKPDKKAPMESADFARQLLQGKERPQPRLTPAAVRPAQTTPDIERVVRLAKRELDKPQREKAQSTVDVPDLSKLPLKDLDIWIAEILTDTDVMPDADIFRAALKQEEGGKKRKGAIKRLETAIDEAETWRLVHGGVE